ncbi:zinc finger protein 236 isoform X1 [Eupeodes corollae]|uniref:zinc finger protein 236 isoform X1 n=1 Tax=Eupeodes corollae TaxID=290404 RepID=UPI0024930485|nr:zinc finger protein 236 isoform X1 [Eupeodes corollae]
MEEKRRNLELDKICRVCLSQKKDMRPIFGEMIADMLMECARVKIENTDGWPDKICVQCVHSVSRCHAFKTLVERSDRELREYIKGLTVIFEEPVVEIKTQPASPAPPILQPRKQQQQQTQKESTKTATSTNISNQGQTIQQRQVQTAALPQQIVLSNGQVISTAQIVAHPGTQMAQILNTGPFGQLIQTGNTVQMIQQNGQPAQVVQFQQADSDDVDGQCEIIVRDEMSEDAEYFEDITEVTTHDDIETTEDIIEIHDEEEMIEEEAEDCIIPDANIAYAVEMSEDSDSDEKIYLAEFISSQTSCPSPGRYICNLCRKEFRQIKWLQSHMKSHSNWIKANCKKQPQCEICHRSFKGPGMLRMHMKTHETAEKVPTCSICNKEFKSKTILYRHRQTHQLKSYACGNCTKAFSSPLTLNSHMTKKHPNKPNQYKCAECYELFSGIDDLKVHIQLTGHSVKNDKKDDEFSS